MTGVDPEHDHLRLRVRLGRRLGRDARRRWATTGDHPRRASPRTTTSRSATAVAACSSPDGSTLRGATVKGSTSRRRSTRSSAPVEHLAGDVRRVRRRPRNRARSSTRGRPDDDAVPSSRAATAGFPDASVQTRQESSTKEDARVRPVPARCLRAARPLGDRQPLRDGQHAGPRRCSSARASSGCCARSG